MLVFWGVINASKTTQVLIKQDFPSPPFQALDLFTFLPLRHKKKKNTSKLQKKWSLYDQPKQCTIIIFRKSIKIIINLHQLTVDPTKKNRYHDLYNPSKIQNPSQKKPSRIPQDPGTISRYCCCDWSALVVDPQKKRWKRWRRFKHLQQQYC